MKYDPSGNPLSSYPGYSVGLVNASGPITDGLDRIWVSDVQYSGNIGAIDSSGTTLTPAGGYRLENDPGNGYPNKDIDQSGNLWLATGNSTLVEFVGIAAPVVRPLATAVATNGFGARP